MMTDMLQSVPYETLAPFTTAASMTLSAKTYTVTTIKAQWFAGSLNAKKKDNLDLVKS